MRIFQNSNKVIGLRMKMPATADNTSIYATGYRPSPKFLAMLGTSDMRQPLYDISLLRYCKGKFNKIKI